MNLAEGNFSFTPENSNQSLRADNFTDIGALNASGLQYNMSIMQDMNMTNMSVLEGIQGIRNNNVTGEKWFVYINGTRAEENFGMNPVSNGSNLSFWYTTEENGKAAIENATYVADITVAIEEGMEPQIGPEPGQNLTVLYNGTVNLTEGNVVFRPNTTRHYTIGNLTDFGALYATELGFNASLTQNITGDVANMTNVSFVIKSIERIENNNTTGEMWFLYINGQPAEEDFGMNKVSNGDNLNFWYTTEEGGEAAIGNATYVVNITVAAEEEMEPQPGQNLTVLYNNTANMIKGNFTFIPENSTQSYQANNFTDIGALNATGLHYNVSIVQDTNMTNMSVLDGIEGIRNNNTTGEMWFTYINGKPAEEDFGMNPVAAGDNLSFWYTTGKNREAEIKNATYVVNIAVAIEEEVPAGGGLI